MGVLFNILINKITFCAAQPILADDARYTTEWCIDDTQNVTFAKELNEMTCRSLGQPNEGLIREFYVFGTADTPIVEFGDFVLRTVYHKQYSFGTNPLSYSVNCSIASYTKTYPGNLRIHDFASNYDGGFWSCYPWSGSVNTLECETLCLNKNTSDQCESRDVDFYNLLNRTQPLWASCVPPPLGACADPSPLPTCMCEWICTDTKYNFIWDHEILVYPSDVTIPPFNSATLTSSGTEIQNVLETRSIKLKWRRTTEIQSISDDSNLVAYINFISPLITIDINVEDTYSVLIQKDQYRNFDTFNGDHKEYTLPSSAMTSSGTLTVTLLSGDKEILRKEFSVVGISQCLLSDCFLCTAYWNYYWYCAPPTIRIAMSIEIALIAICFFGVIWLVIAIFLYVMKGLKLSALSAFYILFYPGIRLYNLLSSCFKGMKDKNRKEETIELVDSGNDALDEYRRRKKMSSVPIQLGTNKFFNAVILISFLIGIALGCDNAAIIPVSINNCQMNGNRETCEIKGEIGFSLPYPGSTACITLFNNETNTVYGSMNISFTDSIRMFPLNQAYWTSDYEIHAQSHHLCYSLEPTDFCSLDGQQCDYVNSHPEKPLTSFGNKAPILSDPAVNNGIGRARCRRVPGCLTNNCFLCSPACIVSRASVLPKGLPVQVFTIGSSNLAATVSITTDFTSTVDSCNQIGMPCTFKNFTIILDSMTTNTIVSLPNKILKRGSDIRYGSATDANVLTAGNIGELQSQFETGFQNNQFSIANGLFTVADSGNQDVYTYTQPAVSSTFNLLTKIPAAIDGNYLTLMKNNYLRVNMSSGQVLGRVLLPRSLVVTRIVTVVCPKIVSASIEGCSVCDSGATIKVNVSSTCAEGSSFITTDDDSIVVLTKTIKLSQTIAEYTVYVDLSNRYNDFNIIISSGSKSDKFKLTIDAIPGVKIRNGTEISVNGTNIAADNGVNSDLNLNVNANLSNFWNRVFSGAGSILDIVYVCLIFLGIIIVTILMLMAIYKIYKFIPVNKKKYI